MAIRHFFSQIHTKKNSQILKLTNKDLYIFVTEKNGHQSMAS